MDELYTFSKIHQYDDRKSFKEAWNKWVEDNTDIVNKEINRLSILKYHGNILDKMFKSARYYFRKKTTIEKPQKERCQYISVQKELLSAMDQHIIKNIEIKEESLKPSDGFYDFCENNRGVLQDELSCLIKLNITDLEVIQNKIKKTYKNRYFAIQRKISKNSMN